MSTYYGNLSREQLAKKAASDLLQIENTKLFVKALEDNVRSWHDAYHAEVEERVQVTIGRDKVNSLSNEVRDLKNEIETLKRTHEAALEAQRVALESRLVSETTKLHYAIYDLQDEVRKLEGEGE